MSVNRNPPHVRLKEQSARGNYIINSDGQPRGSLQTQGAGQPVVSKKWTRREIILLVACGLLFVTCLILIIHCLSVAGVFKGDDDTADEATVHLSTQEQLDFFYYYPNNTVEERVDTNPSGDVYVRLWSGVGDLTADPIAFGPPDITSLTIPAGASYPTLETYHLHTDAYYVLIQGLAVVRLGSATHEFVMGDFFWAMAGMSIGPLINVGLDDLIVYVVGAEWDPRPDAANITGNEFLNSPTKKYNTCTFSKMGTSLCEYSGEHTGDLLNYTEGGAEPCLVIDPNDPFANVPKASCLRTHYHPRGSLYFGLVGNMFYAQDYPEMDAWIEPGWVRWVRPGFFYGPEYTNDGCKTLALHPSHGGAGLNMMDNDTAWISYDEPPTGPFVVQYSLVVSKVWDEPISEDEQIA